MAEPVVLTVLGAAAALLAVAMACLVFRAAPRGAPRRILGGILLIEGAAQLTIFIPSGGEGVWRMALEGLFIAPYLLLPWLYLLFLAHLVTPLAQPLRRWRPAIKTVLIAANAAFSVGLLQLAVFGTEPVWLFPLIPFALLTFGAASIYGLVLSVSAWRRATRGTLARERNAAYALAFGARDGFVVLGVAAFFLEEAIAPHEGIHVPALIFLSLATLLFVPLLAYGILRSRLLGMEAQVRWSVSHGTLAIIFLAVFMAASQAAALVIAPRWGTAAGIVAAGLLVLGLVPLRQFADRLAHRAVPDASSTTLLDARRIEVYEAALQELAPEGEPVDEAAAQYLAALRQRLLITPTDHAVLVRVLRTRVSAPPQAKLQPGARVLDRFQVVQALGEGGEGKTFLAEDLQLQRAVVLKVMQPASTPEKALREARALAALRHPNVAIVHDVHLVGEGTMLVIEHVDGGSLRDRLSRGPLEEAEWRRLAADLLAALEAVHEQGLVHGDVKPGNVLLTREGVAKLADFGLARVADEDATRTAGAAAGTPRYMSPEQMRGASASPLSDLYAAGLTLAEARHGRSEILGSEDPLAPWFRRALERVPSRRFPSARAMRDALDAAFAEAQRS